MLSISDTFYALHTPEFRDETCKPAAHEAIAKGASLIAQMTLRTLTDSAFRKAVEESYQNAKAQKL